MGDFVRNIRLFGLIVVVEMPWQITDGTDCEYNNEQRALRGFARYEI
jgi:hypothetical protein